MYQEKSTPGFFWYDMHPQHDLEARYSPPKWRIVETEDNHGYMKSFAETVSACSDSLLRNDSQTSWSKDIIVYQRFPFPLLHHVDDIYGTMRKKRIKCRWNEASWIASAWSGLGSQKAPTSSAQSITLSKRENEKTIITCQWKTEEPSIHVTLAIWLFEKTSRIRS